MAELDAIRSDVSELHAELPRNGLVVWTSGNLSARVPGAELMVIKPSGVPYAELTPEAMVVCDFDGAAVEGSLEPSSDAATHGYVYRHLPDVGGIVHTHSAYATAWAVRAEPIPCVMTAMMCEDAARIVHLARSLGPVDPLEPESIDALYARYQSVYGQH